MCFKRPTFLGIIIFFLISISGFTQMVSQEIDIREILDGIIEEDGYDENYEIRFEQLYKLTQNKINLNQTSFEELSKLVFMSDFQTLSLLDYVDKTGQIYSFFELQTIMGFDRKLIEKLQYFAELGDKQSNKNFSNVFRNSKQEVLFRYSRTIENSAGFQNDSGNFIGSPDRLYIKYQLDADKRIKFGFVGDKDAGEDFFNGSNPQGFDFYSAHIQMNQLGKIDRLILGDYHANFGQGLVMQSSPLFSGSSFVLNNYQKEDGIKKSSSGNESKFLRGTAFTATLKNLELTMFLSYKLIDANIEDSLITSLPITGLHQTQTNIQNEKILKEKISGIHFSYNVPKFKTGITAVYTGFNYDFTPGTDLYQQFKTLNKNNFNASIDFRARMRNVILFGENAGNLQQGFAAYNGFLFLLSDKISMIFSHRYFNKDYNSYFAETFSQTGLVNNESGIYSGLEIKPIEPLKISFFADIYHFPWLRYNTSTQSNGYEFFLQGEYSLNLNSSIKLIYKQESKPKNKDGLFSTFVENDLKNYIRIDYKYSLSSRISLVHRLDLVKYVFDQIPSRAYLFFTDLNYSFYKLPLTLKMRYSFFNTDSFDSRIYTYENDVLYSFSIPAFYDKGFRYYVMVQYKFKNGISMWLRLAQTQFADLKSIGTGLNEIQGNRKSDIKFQIMYKF